MAAKEKVIPVFQPMYTIEEHELTKNLHTERYDIHGPDTNSMYLSCLTVEEAQYWAHSKGLEFRSREGTKTAAEAVEHAVSGN